MITNLSKFVNSFFIATFYRIEATFNTLTYLKYVVNTKIFNCFIYGNIIVMYQKIKLDKARIKFM